VPWVAATFASSTTLLGYLVGRLAMARAAARRATRTIAAQRDALAASERAAAEAEKLAAVGRLAAGIAHEVRNPLGVIRASAALAQEHFSPTDDAHRALRFILEEIDRLDALIAKLLAFARPTVLTLRPVRLGQLVERIAALADERLRKHDVTLQSELGGLAAAELPADPDLLAQLLLGLVTNACEAIGSGGRVALRARRDAGALRVEVADDGPGVPRDAVDSLFEPFFTTKPSGTGLGLAMAERIAVAHGGVLALDEAAGLGAGGRGACFVLRLPLERGPAPDIAG
jgi:two-component system sensor histidine kinase HydH